MSHSFVSQSLTDRRTHTHKDTHTHTHTHIYIYIQRNGVAARVSLSLPFIVRPFQAAGGKNGGKREERKEREIK